MVWFLVWLWFGCGLWFWFGFDLVWFGLARVFEGGGELGVPRRRRVVARGFWCELGLDLV